MFTKSFSQDLNILQAQSITIMKRIRLNMQISVTPNVCNLFKVCRFTEINVWMAGGTGVSLNSVRYECVKIAPVGGVTIANN